MKVSLSFNVENGNRRYQSLIFEHRQIETRAQLLNLRYGLHDWREFSSLADLNQHKSLPRTFLPITGSNNSSNGVKCTSNRFGSFIPSSSKHHTKDQLFAWKPIGNKSVWISVWWDNRRTWLVPALRELQGQTTINREYIWRWRSVWGRGQIMGVGPVMSTHTHTQYSVLSFIGLIYL